MDLVNEEDNETSENVISERIKERTGARGRVIPDRGIVRLQL